MGTGLRGPFHVVLRNRGGTYMLRDRLGEQLKLTGPMNQLKLVTRIGEQAIVNETSYLIDKIVTD
eukprot:IDg14363t1